MIGKCGEFQLILGLTSDLANAACGALALAHLQRESFCLWGGGSSWEEELEFKRREAATRFAEVIQKQGYWWPGE